MFGSSRLTWSELLDGPPSSWEGPSRRSRRQPQRGFPGPRMSQVAQRVFLKTEFFKRRLLAPSGSGCFWLTRVGGLGSVRSWRRGRDGCATLVC